MAPSAARQLALAQSALPERKKRAAKASSVYCATICCRARRRRVQPPAAKAFLYIARRPPSKSKRSQTMFYFEHEEHRQGEATQAVGSSGAAARQTLPHPHGTPVRIRPKSYSLRGSRAADPRFAFKGRQTALPSDPLRQAGFKIQGQQATLRPTRRDRQGLGITGRCPLKPAGDTADPPTTTFKSNPNIYEHEEHRQGDTTQAVGSSGAAARQTLPPPTAHQ